MKACPSGWHLPNDKEWQTLVDLLGGIKIAGKKLKDKNGFSALLGGIGVDGEFDDIGVNGNWWSASEWDEDNSYGKFVELNDKEAKYGGEVKELLFSVRCLQN